MTIQDVNAIISGEIGFLALVKIYKMHISVHLTYMLK